MKNRMKKNLAFVVIITTISFFYLGCGTKSTTSSGTLETSSLTKFEEDILYHVNRHRRSKGLSTLEVNNVISVEARKHSQQMATGRVSLGHSGFSARVQKISSQLGPVNKSAENVAAGSRTAEEAVTNWLNSPGHRQNIEGSFTLTGIGVARNSKGVVYFTQLFIKR
jgi:uncharacterized protein YkwD